MKLSEALSIVREASTVEGQMSMPYARWANYGLAKSIVVDACIANSEALTALLQDAAREGGAK